MIYFLKLLIMVAFFGNWFAWLGFIPQAVTWLLDIIPIGLLIFICVKNRWNIEWHYKKTILLIASIICLSCVMNGSGYLKAILFFRMLFHFYPLYIALTNSNLSEHSMREIVRWICVLMAIQLPTAIVKFFVYGQGENAIGTYAFHGGGLSTLIPLVVIGYVFSAWLFDNSKKKQYILIFFAAIAFAIIGGKRGFVFFLPVVLFGILFSMRPRLKQNMNIILMTIILMLFAVFLSLKFIPTLNVENKIGGSVDLDYAIHYAKEYNLNTTEDHMTEGRLLTPQVISKWLFDKGYTRLLLGVGPGTFMQSIAYKDSQNLIRKKLPILYGTSGFFLLALQIGFIGSSFYALLYVFIMKHLFECAKKESSLYWKILSCGTGGFAFVYIFLDLTYGQYTSCDLTLLVFFILASFVRLRCNKVKNKERVFDLSLLTRY